MLGAPVEQVNPLFFFFFFKKFLLVYFLRERERTGEGQGEREGGNPKRAPCAVSTEPNAGLELMHHQIIT